MKFCYSLLETFLGMNSKKCISCKECRHLILSDVKIVEELTEFRNVKELQYYYCEVHNRYVLISNEICNDYDRR